MHHVLCRVWTLICYRNDEWMCIDFSFWMTTYWFLQIVCAASTNHLSRCCWMRSHIDRFKYLGLHRECVWSYPIILECVCLFIFWCCLSVKDDLKWYKIRWSETETEYEHEHCLIKNWGWKPIQWRLGKQTRDSERQVQSLRFCWPLSLWTCYINSNGPLPLTFAIFTMSHQCNVHEAIL